MSGIFLDIRIMKSVILSIIYAQFYILLLGWSFYGFLQQISLNQWVVSTLLITPCAYWLVDGFRRENQKS